MNDIINNPKATIVDVRSEMEFIEGHVEGSFNIPLNEIPERLEEFKGMSKPLVVCCLSGGRSGQAMAFLQQNGIQDVHNGGGWQQVKMHKI